MGIIIDDRIQERQSRLNRASLERTASEITEIINQLKEETNQILAGPTGEPHFFDDGDSGVD